MIRHILLPLHRVSDRWTVAATNQAIADRHLDTPPCEDIVRAIVHRNAAERRLQHLPDGHRWVPAACGVIAGVLAFVLTAQAFGWLPGVLS